MSNTWDSCQFPLDLTGKSFLDIGCWEGRFCVQATQRGAEHVLGIDGCACNPLRKNIEEYGFNFVQMDIQSEKFWSVPEFDIVSCCGVLYHLENPLGALFKLRKITKELLVLETLISTEQENIAYMRFWPAQAGSPFEGGTHSLWWSPNELAVRQMLETVGFKITKTAFRVNHESNVGRLCLHAEPSGNVDYRKVAYRIPRKMEVQGGLR